MTNDSNFTNLFGWTYGYANGKFQIIPDVEYEIPSTFYKHYALNENSVDSLTNTYIYATHPNQLNDRLDCHEQLIDFDTPEIIRKYFCKYETIADLLKIPDEQLFNKENRKLFQNIFKILTYQNFGIFSMTENLDNILMWSHYAQNSGFCLEMDITFFPFKYSGPFPINYQEHISPIALSGIPPGSAIAAQTNIKKDVWKYEKEWRLLIHAPKNFQMKVFGYWHGANQPCNHDRKFRYPAKAIKRIILGVSFFSWGELSSEDEKQWTVNLNPTHKSFHLKKEVLNFVIDKNIDLGIIQPHGLNHYSSIPLRIKHIPGAENSYSLLDINAASILNFQR